MIELFHLSVFEVTISWNSRKFLFSFFVIDMPRKRLSLDRRSVRSHRKRTTSTMFEVRDFSALMFNLRILVLFRVQPVLTVFKGLSIPKNKYNCCHDATLLALSLDKEAILIFPGGSWSFPVTKNYLFHVQAAQKYFLLNFL